MSSIIERARTLRSKIELLSVHLDDAEAAEAVELFPAWDGNGRTYTAGDRIQYAGILYKVLLNHISQTDWKPDSAPSLFAEVLIPTPDVIPVWKQPDSTNPYMTGDKVHYPDEDGPVYESIIDNNVWSPESHPAGWKEV